MEADSILPVRYQSRLISEEIKCVTDPAAGRTKYTESCHRHKRVRNDDTLDGIHSQISKVKRSPDWQHRTMDTTPGIRYSRPALRSFYLANSSAYVTIYRGATECTRWGYCPNSSVVWLVHKTSTGTTSKNRQWGMTSKINSTLCFSTSRRAGRSTTTGFPSGMSFRNWQLTIRYYYANETNSPTWV